MSQQELYFRTARYSFIRGGERERERQATNVKKRDEARPRSRENPLAKVSGRDLAIGDRLFHGGYAVDKLHVSPVQEGRERKRK